MAVTHIYPIHGQSGKTIQQVLKQCLDYFENPEKTQNGKHISYYHCHKNTVVEEFISVKNLYQIHTGRQRANSKNVVAYMLLQSFLPKEIEPEQANQLGYQLAMKFTQGQHQFVVATHSNQSHIHNHILLNSNALDMVHKFDNYKNSYQKLAEISDTICKENNLSIVADKQKKGKNYKQWSEEKKGTSWKAKLKERIDKTLPHCSTWEEFLAAMRSEGYEVKQKKQISFRAVGQERFTRMKTLGKEYTEDALFAKIENHKEKINLMIDIPQCMQQGKGEGYAHWAKLFNLKEAAKTMNYFIENNLADSKVFEQKLNDTRAEFSSISEKIKQLEKEMGQISNWKNHILQYSKTKKTYAAYKESHFSKTYRAAHEGEILLHEASKKIFLRD